MKFELLLTEKARENITRLPAVILPRIQTGLERIAQDPYCGKALKGQLHGLRSYRVGDYRIIYEIHSKRVVIIILTIGHRKEIYRAN